MYICIAVLQDCVSGDVIEHEFVAYKNDSNCYELLLKVDEEGHYVGCVKYAGNRLGPPYFTILSLSGEIIANSLSQTTCVGAR